MVNGVLVTFLTSNGLFKWNALQTGWLLGVPVLVGSVLRLPVGMLTDKWGGKWVMSAILFLSALPMYFLSHANSYGTFLLLSFGFGISGSSFAAGVAYISQWYPKEKQGTALGIFGAGNAGAALTTLLAPNLLSQLTRHNTELEAWRILPQIYAALLIVVAIIFLVFTENKKPEVVKSFSQRFAPLKKIEVWRLGIFYFFVFGSFVALSQWLIPYYVNVYSMSIITAGFMTSAFNLPSGLIRIVGGIMADKFGARILLSWVFGICIVCLFFLFPPRVEIQTPGQGIMASQAGTVQSISENEIVIIGNPNATEKIIYPLQNKEDHITIRFGIHHNQEGFLPLPSTRVWQEPQIKVGDKISKGQLLAKGVTQIYFQANQWIFSTLVFFIGTMMGIGGAAVFKHISNHFPNDIGAVGGIVGVLGGLGGFFEPIFFGYLLNVTGVWTTCWIFLFLVALVCIVWLRNLSPTKSNTQ
ncbi:MAG: MFS transporter [Bacteroidetes bacterium]|nr:MFS transporter [Bacteroidota bacterium]MBS1541262.1 MFS transporter [Bacteroidota bacterium]